jgi:hypothetical protein
MTLPVLAQAIFINDVQIRQEERGRYCLNDLHAASGGDPRHLPSQWLRSDQAKALVDVLKAENSECEFALRIEPLVTISRGNPSTWAVKELVYAYAMWISPKFELKVIRAYDAMVTSAWLARETETADALAERDAQIFEQREKLFARYPFWRLVYDRVLVGQSNTEIAHALVCKIDRVARAVGSMLRNHILTPVMMVRHRTSSQQTRNLIRAGRVESYGKPRQMALMLVDGGAS